ncbi:MAG: hypothetical protein AVDCRST_MAG93-9203 [uncultured Chloroflexia bacterium]|uniref:Uncharacterized protein n=1 Tax=uncultured Chloroflexia bacterium TaxID=1672391 RepID=A0A6J4N9E4_9CHLR|nr:MAG: hypothetical protein AVDCRST_MAG93-9203 [uncultured Chloroflexia bacterium]
MILFGEQPDDGAGSQDICAVVHQISRRTTDDQVGLQLAVPMHLPFANGAVGNNVAAKRRRDLEIFVHSRKCVDDTDFCEDQRKTMR